MLVVKHLDWSANDSLMTFMNKDTNAGLMCLDKYAGGGKQFTPYMWATAFDPEDDSYRDDLFNILKNKATDCYLYEQVDDFPARIYSLQSFGWKRISEDPRD